MTRRYVVAAALLAGLLGLHSGQAASSSSAAEQNNTPPDQTEIPIVVQLPYGLPFNSVGLNDPGEVQSTVIPPGKKTQCPSGCLLISNDNDKDPGRIVSFALDKLGGLPVIATNRAVPRARRRSTDGFGSGAREARTVGLEHNTERPSDPG